MLLLLVALLCEPPLPPPGVKNLAGFLYLSLVGAALTYLLWFRGLARFEPATVAPVGFLSPGTTVILGW